MSVMAGSYEGVINGIVCGIVALSIRSVGG